MRGSFYRSQAASMDQRNDAQTRLWIPKRDSRGNLVDARLIEAAHKIWERARLVVTRYLADDTDAHTAEVQFRKKLNRAIDRLRTTHHHTSPGIMPNGRI